MRFAEMMKKKTEEALVASLAREEGDRAYARDIYERFVKVGIEKEARRGGRVFKFNYYISYRGYIKDMLIADGFKVNAKTNDKGKLEWVVAW
jgi:hypothetical protein